MAALFTFGNFLTSILLILTNTLQNSHFSIEITSVYQVFDNSGALNSTIRGDIDICAIGFDDSAHGRT